MQFIKLLTGDANVKIGNRLSSQTSDIQVVHFFDKSNSRNVTIVDTPGFDDSRPDITDTDILKMIAQFLLNEWVNLLIILSYV